MNSRLFGLSGRRWVGSIVVGASLLVGATVTSQANAASQSNAASQANAAGQALAGWAGPAVFATKSTTDPMAVSSTVFTKLTAPGGNLFTVLNVSGQLVAWLANPTTLSVFLPPDSGRTIPAPSGVEFRGHSVVGNSVFAVDSSSRLLMAQLDRGGFTPVANVPGAAGLYATQKEIWVRSQTNGKSTMKRFDGATGKALTPLNGIYSLLTSSADRVAAIADGPDAKTLVLVIFDASTMKELRRDKFTKVIASGAWVSRDLLLLGMPDGVMSLDLSTKQLAPVKGVQSEDIIGDPKSGTLLALSNGRLAYWLPVARKVIDVGIAPTGGGALRDGVFWAWDKSGLVRIDLVRLAAELAKGGNR